MHSLSHSHTDTLTLFTLVCTQVSWQINYRSQLWLAIVVKISKRKQYCTYPHPTHTDKTHYTSPIAAYMTGKKSKWYEEEKCGVFCTVNEQGGKCGRTRWRKLKEERKVCRGVNMPSPLTHYSLHWLIMLTLYQPTIWRHSAATSVQLNYALNSSIVAEKSFKWGQEDNCLYWV